MQANMINPHQHQDTCLLCKRAGIQSARAERILGLTMSQPQRHIYQCKMCDLYWLSPQLTDQEKKDLYSNSYFEDENRKYSYDLQVKECEQCFIETASKLAQLIPKNSNILDVGCANGRFLEICKAYGINCTGVEFSPSAVESARKKGLNIISGDINHPDLNNQKFNAIHMSHVLEHLDNPRATIQKLHTLLKPNGIIYIEVPRQLDSWLDRINEARKKYYNYGPFSLHHSVFFSPKSLTLLLESEGFIIEKIKTARSCKRASRKGFSALLIKIIIALSAVFNHGDLVCVYARKKA